jgi:YggT family protein
MIFGILRELVHFAAYVINTLIFIRVIMSWFNPNQFNPLIVQLYRITDPILKPFQDIIPPGRIGIDISPIFAFIAVQLIEKILINLLSIF